MIEMQQSKVIYVSSGYIWGVINLTLLTINIFKGQLILGFWSCCSTILTFGNFTDKDLSYLVFIKSYIEISSKNSFDHLKPPPNGALLFNQFNNSSSEQQIDPENVVNSRYFDIVQIYFQILHCCFWIESLWAPLWPPV